MEATNASSSSWMTLMIGEWKAMLTRKRVNRYPFSFSLPPRFLIASVLPLRMTWFGELILPMWTSFSPWIISFSKSKGASVAAMTPGRSLGFAERDDPGTEGCPHWQYQFTEPGHPKWQHRDGQKSRRRTEGEGIPIHPLAGQHGLPLSHHEGH